MKKLFSICALLALSTESLFSTSLKIAETIRFYIPDGWEYVESAKKTMPELGTLTSALLENASTNQTLSVSVLRVDEVVPGVQYSTELIEATLSPYVEAYRKHGSHYYPRKILGRDNFVYYFQEVGRLDAPKVELRGVLMKVGDNWVNYFCMGPDEVTWEQYVELIRGTRLIE